MKSNPFFMKNPVVLILVLIGLVIGGVCWLFVIKEKRALARPDDVEVLNTWELPDKLMEVSGIAWIDENRIACVQDEEGIIFVYNIASSTIEREIPFGENGDYESIALVDENAYVLRSDGTLFEINDFMENSPTVREYDTPMTEDHDLEGLCHDKIHQRLLFAMKESDHEDNDYKGVFAFDLATKKLDMSPVFKLKMPSDAKKFRPSEIEIDPEGNLYVLTAKEPRIILFEDEQPVEIYQLNEHVFPQVEGLSFGPRGKIFISSEGKPGKIFQIVLQK